MRHLSAWSYISIHALRVEGDDARPHVLEHGFYFYPRPPGGGRLIYQKQIKQTAMDFYPRPPGGGRLCKRARAAAGGHFYPRSLGGGRPDYATLTSQTEYISIHALQVEGDPVAGSV